MDQPAVKLKFGDIVGQFQISILFVFLFCTFPVILCICNRSDQLSLDSRQSFLSQRLVCRHHGKKNLRHAVPVPEIILHLPQNQTGSAYGLHRGGRNKIFLNTGIKNKRSRILA